MKIAIIGTGYVGLVVGTCLSSVGHKVTCVDHDEAKIETLRRGHVPIYEPGLEAMIAASVENDRLHFDTDTGEASSRAEVVFIAVGTPPGEDGSADLSHVLAAAREIARHITRDDVIVVCKSTVPVGTCDRVRETIAAITPHRFHVVSNPEFLKEGSALSDFQSPERVIIGASDEGAAARVAKLYDPFMRRDSRVLIMDVRSAEMTKYASNAMLAAKISFINEIANLCDVMGADVEHVRHGMSMDERIGPHFIYPGVGYGGSCFPKDVRALAKLGQSQSLSMDLLSAIERVNRTQKTKLVDIARHHFGDDGFDDKVFAVWGLSFKPRTDDVREAPALATIRRLVHGGARILAHDPVASDNASRALANLPEGSFRVVEDAYDALHGAHALFVFTEWSQYRVLDIEQFLANTAPGAVIFDGRNIYDPKTMAAQGIAYYTIGRNLYQHPRADE